jgi:hypothetical protein
MELEKNVYIDASHRGGIALLDNDSTVDKTKYTVL